MKKNGFTLVELLAVIILLAIIMTIAVPSALKLSGKVKQKSYSTKIDLIEQAANSYGQGNVIAVRKGLNAAGKSWLCQFTYDSDDTIVKVDYTQRDYSDGETLQPNTYRCIQVTVDKLVETNNLDWDEKEKCDGKCTDAQKAYYNNVVLNPVNNAIINKCYVYIYYRNKRIYSHFDRTSCDGNKNDNFSAVVNGREYSQFKG